MFVFLLFRYLFESDHKKFFPTICLENGPIDLGIMWPEAAVVVPRFDEVSYIHVSGPNCSKLTMSLVNKSTNFQMYDV